jgi:hypothetical protein
MDELTNNNVVGTSMLTYGSYWYFTVEPGDGDSLGEVVRSPTVIIRNSAPEVSNAVIIPNSPTTADGLEAKVELSDKDNDENFKFDYDWYKDDILQTGLSGWNSVSADMTARGEVWYFTVSVSDGKSWSPVYQSDPVTIVNSVPEATELSISLEEAFASTPLYLEYTYFDLDSDPERGTEVRWYLNDLPVTEFNDKYMIPSYMLTEGDEWYCTVRAGDGWDKGAPVTSPTVQINTIPIITNLQLTPAEPVEGDTLAITYDYFDSDDDSEEGTEILWYRDSKQVEAYNGRTILPDGIVSVGETWYATVQPSDGKEHGLMYQSNKLEIQGDEIESVSETTPPEKSGSGDRSMIWITVIIAIIIIILLSFLILRSRRKPSNELQPELVIAEDADVEWDEDIQSVKSHTPPSPPSPEPRQKITTKSIPIREVVPDQSRKPRPTKKKKLSQLNFEQIEIEFHCHRCDNLIEAGIEHCPSCGEEFGELD